MEFTRDSIKSMKFGIYKGKYYIGSEVDSALDKLETAADDMLTELEDYRAKESSILSAMVDAQDLKSKILDEARTQADAELALAREKADAELREARMRKAAIEAEIETLKEKRDNFRRQIRDEIQLHLDMLADSEEDTLPEGVELPGEEISLGSIASELEEAVPEDAEEVEGALV